MTTQTEHLNRAHEALTEAIAYTVRNDLVNDGELVTTGPGSRGGTVDVLYRLHWALDAIDAARSKGAELRSA